MWCQLGSFAVFSSAVPWGLGSFSMGAPNFKKQVKKRDAPYFCQRYDGMQVLRKHVWADDRTSINRMWTWQEYQFPSTCMRGHELGEVVVAKCRCPACGEVVPDDATVIACPECASEGMSWKQTLYACSLQCCLAQDEAGNAAVEGADGVISSSSSDRAFAR